MVAHMAPPGRKAPFMISLASEFISPTDKANKVLAACVDFNCWQLRLEDETGEDHQIWYHVSDEVGLLPGDCRSPHSIGGSICNYVAFQVPLTHAPPRKKKGRGVQHCWNGQSVRCSSPAGHSTSWILEWSTEHLPYGELKGWWIRPAAHLSFVISADRAGWDTSKVHMWRRGENLFDQLWAVRPVWMGHGGQRVALPPVEPWPLAPGPPALPEHWAAHYARMPHIAEEERNTSARDIPEKCLEHESPPGSASG